jgi:O-methyltransferase
MGEGTAIGGIVLDDGERRYLELLKQCLTASIYEESSWGFAQIHVQMYKKRLPRSRTLWALLERVLKVAAKRSMLVLLELPYNPEVRAEGKDWPLFGYSMIGQKRLNNVQACIEDVVRRSVPGDLVETGVWRGGTVIFMRAVLKALNISDRRVWACDSFEGLPKPASATSIT